MGDRFIHVLPDLNADGPTQMATDEAMIESARAGTAVVRFYTWDRPTLSLGYFQRADDRLADPKLAGMAFVRRPTGGGAIVHDHELTYSLALPPGPTWQPRDLPWTCEFHRLLITALGRFGVSTRGRVCGEERGAGSFLCFEHHTAGDVVIDDEKVVGSAQRRPRGALLQHGSVLLKRSEFAPHLPGISDLTGRTLAPTELRAALLEVLHGRGWEVREFDPGPEFDRTVAHLRAAKYQTPEWNRLR